MPSLLERAMRPVYRRLGPAHPILEAPTGMAPSPVAEAHATGGTLPENDCRSLVSAIVVTYESADYISSALTSIEQHGGMPVETLMVDNASTDDTVERARVAAPATTILAQARNTGFAAAVNVAAAQASGRYLLLLNPDAVLLPDALPRLFAHLEAHPTVGAVGPRLIYADGEPQDSAFTYPSLIMTWLDFFPWPRRLIHSRINGRLRSTGDAPFEIVHPLGACMLIRRDAWDDVGPFDEAFFLYCEEVDWCVRARKRGWKIDQVPTAVAMHHAGRSAATAPSASLRHLYASRKRLHAKHRGLGFQLAALLLTNVGQRARRRTPKAVEPEQ